MKLSDQIMKWERIIQRENDFLKNYILYEVFKEDFPQVFGRHYFDFLTIREGMSYIHYYNNESSEELSEFVVDMMQKDLDFVNNMFEKGKIHFDNLLYFSDNLTSLEDRSSEELLLLFEKYVLLYKAPYPYFLLSLEAKSLEKQKTKDGEKMINVLAKLRLYGRSSFNKTHNLILPLFEKIACKLGISVKELKFLKPDEIKALLKGEKVDVNLLNKERQKCFFIYSKGHFTFHENASIILHYDEEKDINVNEIKGHGAFPGIYRGKVRLIKSIDDMKRIEEGDVIVLQMTTTDLITKGLKKVGGIITDEGGITCHAAIISREMKKPCIIGTKIATKVFNEGDIVEIDAKRGIARKINT